MIEAQSRPSRTNEYRRDVNAFAVSTDAPYTDAPLAGLAGSDLSARFRHWRGVSGRRYLFSIFPLGVGGAEIAPRYCASVVLAVIHTPDNRRRIVWAGQTGDLPELVFDGEPMRRALTLGANEIHMHLLATDEIARDAMIRDIVSSST